MVFKYKLARQNYTQRVVTYIHFLHLWYHELKQNLNTILFNCYLYNLPNPGFIAFSMHIGVRHYKMYLAAHRTTIKEIEPITL